MRLRQQRLFCFAHAVDPRLALGKLNFGDVADAAWLLRGNPEAEQNLEFAGTCVRSLQHQHEHAKASKLGEPLSQVSDLSAPPSSSNKARHVRTTLRLDEAMEQLCCFRAPTWRH